MSTPPPSSCPPPVHARSRWRSRAWLAALPVVGLTFLAADHVEAPGTKVDAPADITDVYVWHNAATDRFTAVIDVAGMQVPGTGQQGNYDDEVLLTLHIDRNGDSQAEVMVEVRFGQSSTGAWGVEVRNLPGTSAPVVGAVEQVLNAGNGVKVFAGLRDDPFFFDLAGFKATLMTGTLSFDHTRDSFAGTNLTSVVMEMPLSAVTVNGSAPQLRVWATSGRFTVPTAVAAITAAPNLSL